MKAKTINENIDNILKGKSKADIVSSLLKLGPGYYGIIIDFGSTTRIYFRYVVSSEHLIDFIEDTQEYWDLESFDTMSMTLVKIDTGLKHNAFIGYSSQGVEISNNIEVITKNLPNII